MLPIGKKYVPTAKDKEVLKLRLDAFTYFMQARDMVKEARMQKLTGRTVFFIQYMRLAHQLHNSARLKLRRIHEVTTDARSDRLH